MTTPDSWRAENNDATTIYDFLDSSNLQIEEYSISSSPINENQIIETFNIIKKDATLANIRAEIGALESILLDARRWHDDKFLDESFWYRWVTSGESAKRSLIYDYAIQFAEHGIIDRHFTGDSGYYQLALTRHRAWEAPAAATASKTGLSCLGGTWNIGLTGGKLPGRIAKAVIVPAENDHIKNIWMGIRPIRHGVSGFIPLLEAESGSVELNPSADTSFVSTGFSGAASGGSVAKSTFATTEAMENKIFLTPEAVGGVGSIVDYFGRYTVLVRYQTSDVNTQVGIRLNPFLGYSLQYVNQLQAFSTIYPAASTAWRLLELGEISIPPTSWREAISSIGDLGKYAVYRLGLDAERISGSGSLFVDAVILIPSEHAVDMHGMILNANGSVKDGRGHGFLLTQEDDSHEALVAWNFHTVGIPEASFRNWRYPHDGGVLVLAAEQDGLSVVGDVADIDLEIFYRWPTYRD